MTKPGVSQVVLCLEVLEHIPRDQDKHAKPLKNEMAATRHRHRDSQIVQIQHVEHLVTYSNQDINLSQTPVTYRCCFLRPTFLCLKATLIVLFVRFFIPVSETPGTSAPRWLRKLSRSTSLWRTWATSRDAHSCGLTRDARGV